MRRRLLIVEDEEVLRKHLGRLCARAGFEVSCAATRAEALAALAAAPFGVLLLDVRLPDGDGLDLLAGLDDDRRPPRTVVMSAFSTPENAARAADLRVDHVLEKPVDLARLLTALRSTPAP